MPDQIATAMQQPSNLAGRTVISEVLARIDENPGKPCLIFPAQDRVLTYAAMGQECLRLAGLLRGAGAGAGDVVMIFLPTQAETYAAFLGAMLIGAIPTYMPNPSAKQEPGRYWRDHTALLARTTPRVILTDIATAAVIRESGMLEGHDVTLARLTDPHSALAPDALTLPVPNDVALLQHSSGTTGLKKGVMLSHAAVVTQIDAYSAALGADSNDIVATWLPVYHDMGLLSSTLMPLMRGQTIVVLDPFAWAAQPARLLEAISTYRATLVWQPNFAFEHLVRTVREGDFETFDLSCVRAFVNCSEPCRPGSFERFAERFAANGVTPGQLQVCYAMAETVFAITQTPPGRAPRTLTVCAEALREENRARPPGPGETPLSLLSNGKPIAGMSVHAVTPEGTACAEGEVGELLVSGTSLFDGYFRLPAQTTERLGTAGLRTRDMGFVLDGEVYVLGRMDDLIIVHGRNFYAGEVEAAVSRISGVKPGRAVAFGIDNPVVGSQDIVVVAESDGVATAAELSRRIKRTIVQEIGLALHEARIVQPGWLSKTTSGKISRERNRTRYLDEKANIAKTESAKVGHGKTGHTA